MELRHLRYFVTIAEERSFRRASLRLHISQPPLSRTIKQLEDQIGVQLFERSASGVDVTAAGAVFLEEAKRALQVANDAVEKSQRAARGDFGHIEVAYYGSVIFGVIPRLLAVHRELRPRVTVRLSSLAKDRQVRALRDGWLDVGFARYYRSEPDIACEIVWQEPIVVAVPAKHPLAGKSSVAMADLQNEPMIVFPSAPRPSYADELLQLCSKAGFSPNIAHEAEDLVACLALVASGVAIAPVPVSAANINLPNLTFVKLTRPEPKSSLYCVYRKGDTRPLLTGFLETVRSLKLQALPKPASAQRRAR